MTAYIGRQAIYNRDLMVEGYELLYRSSMDRKNAMIVDEDAATRAVLYEAIDIFGLPQLTDHHPAYVNFTSSLLEGDFAYLLDASSIVIDVPTNLSVDDSVARKLSDLRRSGYRLALDGYSEVNGLLRFDKILDCFDVIRINIRGMDRLKLVDLRRRLRRVRAKLLAEQIETEQEFDLAMNMDFSFFQGYFFEKPVCLSKELPQLPDTAYGMLLRELLMPAVNYKICADIIRSDIILTYMFLRRVQGYSLSRMDIDFEIRRGLGRMEQDAMLRWICLVMLKQFNTARSDALARQAFVRGRFLECLARDSALGISPENGFMLGLLSLLDQVISASTDALIQSLNLPDGLKDALLGKGENDYSLFLQYVMIYELENRRLILPDIRLSLDSREVLTLYTKCKMETDTAFLSPFVSSEVYHGNLLR